MKNLVYKTVENSKNTSGESGNNPAGGSGQLTQAQITNLVQVAADMGCTHFQNHFFMDTDAQMQANYSSYSTNYNLRTLEQDTQLWADIIHAAGMKVVYRGTWSGVKNNNGFPYVTFGGGNFVPLGSPGGLFTDNFSVDDLATNYNVTGAWSMGGGTLTSPAANGWNNTCLTKTSYSDFTATGKLIIPSTGNGNTQLIFRGSGGVGYGLQLRLTDAVIRLERYGLANLAQVSKNFTRGNAYNVKVTCAGTHIQCRVWDDGTTEPSTWDIDLTNSSYSSGGIGFSSESAGATYDSLGVDTTITAGEGSYCAKILRFLQTNVGPTHLASGDIIAPISEATEFLSNGNEIWFDTSGGTQAGFYNFFETIHTVVNNYASQLGISLGFFTIINYSEYNSGYLNDTLVVDTGEIPVDYYGHHITSTSGAEALGSSYVRDWNTLRNQVGGGGYPIYQTEMGGIFGDSWPSIGINPAQESPSVNTYEEAAFYQMRFFKALRDGLVDVSPQKMNGMSNWGLWSGQNSSIVYYTNGTYYPNYMGQIYANFLKGNGMARIPVPTTTTFDSVGNRSNHF